MAILQTSVVLIGSWLILGILFTGIGLWELRLFKGDGNKYLDVIDAFWIGWALSIGLLQIWHLGFRVNQIAFSLLLVTGLGGWVFSGLLFRKYWKIELSKGQWLKLVAFVVGSLLLAECALNPPLDYDSGLYHLGNVEWFTRFSIVPGLANIHGRFGFNSSHFLYAALLNASWWADNFHQVANSLIVFIFFIQVVSKISFNTNVSLSSIMRLMLLLSVLWVMGQPGISSPSTDLPSYVLTLQLFFRLFDILENPCLSKALLRKDFLTIVVLSCVAITIKLSLVALSATTIIVVISIIMNRRYWTREFGILLVAVSGFFLVPWVIRGVIQSGYIAYPNPKTITNVQWAVPKSNAENEYNYVRSWARQPNAHWHDVLGDFDWFESWLERVLFQPFVFLNTVLFLLGTMFLLLALGFRSRICGVVQTQLWLSLIPVAVAFVFWFVMAPDPRFAQGIIWVLGVAFFVLSLRIMITNHALFLRFCIVLMVLMAVPIGAQSLLFRSHPSLDVRSSMPIVETRRFITSTGLELWVPIDTDQCWNAGLMCTPYPDRNLALLSPDLGVVGGFFITSTGTR